MMNPPNHLVGSRIKRTQVCHLADLLRSKPGFLQVRPMMERQVLQKTLAGSGRSVAAALSRTGSRDRWQLNFCRTCRFSSWLILFTTHRKARHLSVSPSKALGENWDGMSIAGLFIVPN
jgi:hypothetical protein